MTMQHFRVCDTETTGPNSTPPDVACEVASVDLDWDAVTKTGQLLAPKSELVHIGIPMPPDAQGVHHISDDMLKDARDISLVFKAIVSPFPYPDPDIVFVAHNCEYEQRVLAERIVPTISWICTYKAALRLWPDAPNHKNQTLKYYLKLAIPAKLAGGLPHRALPDAIDTAYLLIECLKLATMEQLIQWTKEPRLLPTCPIGKKQGWAGKRWCEVDAGDGNGGFLRWMLEQPDMEADLKWNAQHELDRRANSHHTVERDAYMRVVGKVIAMAKTVYDLRQWFSDELATREKLGILKGTPPYDEIVKLCKDHTATLPQPVAAVPPPAEPPPAAAPAQPADDDMRDDMNAPDDDAPPADDAEAA